MLRLCSLKGERGAKAKRNIVGLGLIVALASFAYGREAGCRKAEMLAINDDGVLAWLRCQLHAVDQPY